MLFKLFYVSCPGNEIYAHAANEACPVEHLSGAVAFYAALVAKLNGKV